LELTRNTQRPFLTIVNEPNEPTVLDNPVPLGEAALRDTEGKPRVILHVQNTGNLPADDVSISCVFHGGSEGDKGTELRHSDWYAPSTYFPQAKIGHTFYFQPEELQKLHSGEPKIRITIRYANRIAGEEHTTERFFIYDSEAGMPQSPRDSVHKDDWWDWLKATLLINASSANETYGLSRCFPRIHYITDHGG
jgi:hypothetical protein